MHFYNFNPSDFNNSARHLSLPERAIYRDLIDMYYNTEQAIDGSDMDSLARRLLCTTPEYRASLDYILTEYFTKRGKRYHHHRIDKEIKAYRYKNRNVNGNAESNAVTIDVTQGVTLGNDDCNANDAPMTNAERTRKSRQDRKLMIDSLINIGVSVDKGIKAADLKNLYAKHIDDVTRNVTADVTKPVTPSNASCNASHSKNAAITSNYELGTNNQKLKESESTHTQSATVLNNSVDNIKQQQDTKPQPTATAPTVTDKTQIQQQKVSAADSIQNWQPPSLDDMRSELFGAEIFMTLDEKLYDKYLREFKTYYAARPIEPGLRQLRLVQWLKREANNQKSNTAQPRQPQGIDNKDWSQVGQASSSYDSDLPPAFHPSHSAPTSSKPNAEKVMLNGLWFACLPDMNIKETYDYIKMSTMPGESADEVYKRVLAEMEGAA